MRGEGKGKEKENKGRKGMGEEGKGSTARRETIGVALTVSLGRLSGEVLLDGRYNDTR